MPDHAAVWAGLRHLALEIAAAVPEIAPALRDTVADVAPAEGLARLLARVLQPTWCSTETLGRLAQSELGGPDDAAGAALDDLWGIGQRNLEEGDAGAAWTWLGHHGFHILLAHRVANRLWRPGDRIEGDAIHAALASAKRTRPVRQVSETVEETTP